MKGIVIAKYCKVYSCYEKGYRKKNGQNCRRQSLKVIWVSGN